MPPVLPLMHKLEKCTHWLLHFVDLSLKKDLRMGNSSFDIDYGRGITSENQTLGEKLVTMGNSKNCFSDEKNVVIYIFKLN